MSNASVASVAAKKRLSKDLKKRKESVVGVDTKIQVIWGISCHCLNLHLTLWLIGLLIK